MNCFWEIKFVDLLLPALTAIGLVFAYLQLSDIWKHKRIEFTYQLYRDFFNYLNTTENKDLRNWLYGKEANQIDKDKIGDLLEQFEAIWSLQNKNLIEKDVVYDLFAFYILKAAEAKPSAIEYIKEVRIEEVDLIITDDLFIGYETLLNQIKEHHIPKNTKQKKKQKKKKSKH